MQVIIQISNPWSGVSLEMAKMRLCSVHFVRLRHCRERTPPGSTSSDFKPSVEAMSGLVCTNDLSSHMHINSSIATTNSTQLYMAVGLSSNLRFQPDA